MTRLQMFACVSRIAVQMELAGQDMLDTDDARETEEPVVLVLEARHRSGNWIHSGRRLLLTPGRLLPRGRLLCDGTLVLLELLWGGVLVRDELPGGVLVREELPGGVLVREEFPDVRLLEDGRQRSGNWMQIGERLLLGLGRLLWGG